MRAGYGWRPRRCGAFWLLTGLCFPSALRAWIESLFGHIKHEWPHLLDIADPDLLETELARVRTDYSTIRLHQKIGCVTPDDEHHHRGEAIR